MDQPENSRRAPAGRSPVAASCWRLGPRLAAALLLAMLFGMGLLEGQPRPGGRIEVAVTDSSGAPVPNAYLYLRGPVDRETTTGTEGESQFVGLRRGDYQVTVEKSGFERGLRRLHLDGEPVRLEIAIAPAPVRQSVDVVASVDLAAESVEKLPGSLQDSARAVTLIGQEELRRRNLRNVPELLAFIPGMSLNSLRTGGYHFYARGFRMSPDDTRVDGFTGANISGGFGAATFGIEQVVVLRGPAGILFGPNKAPGGLINLVTKRPQPVRSTQFDFRSGSYFGQGIALDDRASGSFDFDSTGAALPSSRLLYRALFTAENQNYFTRGVLDRSRYARGSALYKIDALGLYTITPIFQYGSITRPAGGGIVISPSTSLSVNDGIFGPIETRDLSPHDVRLAAGGQRHYMSQAGFDLRAIPAASWTINLNYRWLRNDRHINQWTPQVRTAEQVARLVNLGEVLRSQSKGDNLNRHHNVEFNAAYEHQGNGWRNMAQTGAYTRVVGVASTTLAGPAPVAAWPIHIFTGLAPHATEDVYPSLVFGAWTYTTTWNSYWQNRTWLFDNRLILTLGLGYGQSHAAGSPVKKGNVIPNYSALFRPAKTLTIYYSYSRSFNPVDPTLENYAGQRNVFDPTTGENHESGARFNVPRRRASAAVSFFKNSISNALVQSGINDVNVNGMRYYLEAGTRRGKGVELSADVHLRPGLFVSAALSFVDAVYTGSGPASAAASLAIPGSRAEKTPRWAWNTAARYERTEGRLAGFGAGLNLLWQDKRLGSNGARTFAAPDPLILPPYLRVDAAVFYRLNRHWDWALNLENLMDRRIFLNATTGASMEMAPPRAVALRMSYRF